MADLVYTVFPGTALPPGWTTDHRAGGAHAVSGGNLTLTTTGATGSRAIVQSPFVSLADGDTVTVRVGTFPQFFPLLSLRDVAGDASFNVAVYAGGGPNWNSSYYRIATGHTNFTSAVSVATHPWVRFRRAGAAIVVEAAPDASGVPGTWVLVGTRDRQADGNGGPYTFSAMQLDLIVDGPSTTAVIDQVGVEPPPAGPSAAVLRRRRGFTFI